MPQLFPFSVRIIHKKGFLRIRCLATYVYRSTTETGKIVLSQPVNTVLSLYYPILPGEGQYLVFFGMHFAVSFYMAQGCTPFCAYHSILLLLSLPEGRLRTRGGVLLILREHLPSFISKFLKMQPGRPMTIFLSYKPSFLLLCRFT